MVLLTVSERFTASFVAEKSIETCSTLKNKFILRSLQHTDLDFPSERSLRCTQGY